MEWCCATYGKAYQDGEGAIAMREHLRNLEALPNCTNLPSPNSRPVTSTLPYEFFRSDNRPMAELMSDLTMRVELKDRNSGQRYSVFVKAPKRFVTDFTSRPVGSGIFVSNFGRHISGSIIHDWLYAVGFPRNIGGEKFADQVFFQSIRDSGEHAIGRFTIMTPLRIAPGGNYRGDRERIFWVSGKQPPEQGERIAKKGYLFGASEELADDLRRKTVRICPMNGDEVSNLDLEELSEHDLELLLRSLTGTGT